MEFIVDEYKNDADRLKSIYKRYRHLFLKNDNTHIFELHKPLSVTKRKIIDIELIIKKSVEFDEDNCRLLGSSMPIDDSIIRNSEMLLGNNVFITKTYRFSIDNKTECIETWFIHNESYIARFIENKLK